MDALKKAIGIIGGPSAVARLFVPKITAQAVCGWKVAPANRVLILEQATKMKGDPITRYQLRPDIYGASELEPPKIKLPRRRRDDPPY